MTKILPMILYTKMKSSVRRMKPVFHTQIDESMAEMPRNTNTMVSDPLAKTFMTYLTVVTDFSSMLELMYFWQHIPQKTILRRRTKKKIHQVFLLWCSLILKASIHVLCVIDGTLTREWQTGIASLPWGRRDIPKWRRSPARWSGCS